MKELLTLKQACQYLSIHPEVLRRKAAAGEIPGQKLGRGKKSPWRFDRETLDGWLTCVMEKDAEEIQNTNAVEQLVTTLRTSDDLEKLADALNTLGLLGTEATVDALKPFLESPFEELRWLACRSIIQVLGLESKDLVYGLLQTDSSPRIRLEVAGFFARLSDDAESLQWLESNLESTEDPALRRNIEYQLLSKHPERVVPMLREDLNSSHAAIRYRAFIALNTVEYTEWEADILKMRQDKFPVIRKKAVEFMGLTRNLEMLNPLQDVLNSEEPDDVKREAGLAIARIFEK